MCRKVHRIGNSGTSSKRFGTKSRNLKKTFFTLQPPLRNQHHPRGLPPHPHLHHQGSMTPVSYAKWQHHQNQVPKKYNPLYDTPPTQRAAMVMRPQGLQNVGEIRGVMGVNASPLLNHQPHLRPQRPLLTEPVLSPILTDTEISPLHRTGLGSAPGTVFET